MVSINRKREVLLMAICVVATLAILGATWIGASYFEARAYNRITGANVTTWDALFIQCRVIGEAQP